MTRQGHYIPGAVATVVSAGATVDTYRRMFGSVRWRYFGPRALVEDNSRALESHESRQRQRGLRPQLPRCAWWLTSSTSSTAQHSDIDYFYTSRLPGEPAGGIDDFHVHPHAPRTARVSLRVGF